jgi:endoglucanase
MNSRRAFRALAFALAVLGVWAGPARGDAPLSIRVAGNHFLDGSGQTVRLLGVNRSSPEYACTYGYVASGPGASAEDPSGTDPLDAEDAAAIAAWHADAVRIPLNEDCWLGENGEPAGSLTASGYRQAIASYVGELEADGIYPILDLHWTNPGDLVNHGEPADGQHAMPDAHSLDFWTSVATAFKGDPAVVFDAFNEPYSPAGNGDSAQPVSWTCWKEGGCPVPDADDQETVDPAQTYLAVGMQQVVNAIRAAGADQPILLGGLSYANDLSQWLSHMPTDPDGQLAASFHNYTGEGCATESCWNATIAPLAEQVPVVTGEFGEDDCPPSGEDPDNFDNSYMDWADRHGVGYLGWGWFVLAAPQPCSALHLITDYAGAPADPNGVALHDRLAALAGATASGNPPAPGPVSGLGATAPAPGPSSGTGASRAAARSRARRCRARGRGRRRGAALSDSSLNPGHGRHVCSGVHRGSRPRHHHR